MDLVAHAANSFGEYPALITPETSCSFTRLLDDTARIASAFAEEGIGLESVVALVSPNSGSLLLTLLSLMRMGAIAAPVNNRYPESHISGVLQRLHPSKTLDTETLNQLVSEALTRNSTAFTPAAYLDRPVSIIHTSASSGKPKAVMHTLSNHWHSATGSAENLPFGPGDCWLLSLPLYHVGGYSMLFRSLLGGGALALPAKDEPLSESLDRFPVTHLSLVPTQLYRMLRTTGGAARLRKLKALLLGGSAVSEALLRDAVREKIPLYLTYGSTEMSSQVSTSPAPVSSLQGDSGVVLSFREVLIASDGEILVKGPCLFMGYLEEGMLRTATDPKGWFHTGDMGTLSESRRLTVHGRKDSMFISGGENIHPEEIEKALTSIDGIEEAVVLPAPDSEYGSRPVAWIKVSGENEVTDEIITLKLGELLGKLKTPVCFTRIQDWITLPGSAKIDRNWYRKSSKGS
jgi:O-succinylbenzoic acid--CoA ligase